MMGVFFCLSVSVITTSCFVDKLLTSTTAAAAAAAEAMPSLSLFYLLSLFIYTTCLPSASAKGDLQHLTNSCTNSAFTLFLLLLLPTYSLSFV